MKKAYHYWDGIVEDIYELHDFLDRDLDISLTSEVEFCNGEMWSVRVTEVICYVETFVNEKSSIRHIHLETVLGYELLKDLSFFMRDDYLQSLSESVDPMCLAKREKEKTLEGA